MKFDLVLTVTPSRACAARGKEIGHGVCVYIVLCGLVVQWLRT